MQLTVNGQIFQYPDPGEEAGWGEDATGWAEAVTNALASLIVSGDILPTQITLQNNVITVEDVIGLFFNSNIVRAANISYVIYRESTLTTPGLAESGTILLTLNDTAPIGQKWTMVQTKSGDAGITLSITDGGQIQYLSTDIGLAGYVGLIKFSAKVLSK